MHTVQTRPYAKRSLGQNFLQDANVARKIVAALDLGPEDTVMEIGPGRGALTAWLAHWLEASPSGRVIALEKDQDLAQVVKDEYPRVEVRVADALHYEWEELAGWEHLKYVGNLPYNIASPLIWELVSRSPPYERAVFMVQHEVGLRLASPPGSRQYGALSVWVQSFAQVRYLFRVPPQVFRPRPKVDSAVLEFMPLAQKDRPSDAQNLARLLHICFQKRRKQLRNILRAWWVERVEGRLDGHQRLAEARPEDLTPREFQLLAQAVFKDGEFHGADLRPLAGKK